ncbi:WYL domain-containing protein [Spongiactinospora sp. TRM90649]|uniref:helix-turn-helix transcriptional regulator n=1 Tax=Spongiactinospora sp. TRM90649 TaxID=3031114 RepID=UPI0023F8860F|nr:WYL domain-containing protein [Spongiactinospora sp. TRM90649]MDF5756716.1 WYL domain-containing protein [Spongiactinospora sp. TRM90649]
MRASRLLSLLLLLQTRGRVTAPDIARELEISVRTVYRDVEALSAAGVPVYAERGPAGGYRLLDGYRTRLNGLSPEEAASLFLAALPGPAAELGRGEEAAAAGLKLLAALPPEPRSQATRMRERFHLEVPGWYRGADDVPHLSEVAEAVWEERPLAIRYLRWGPREVDRVVHPYGVVLKGGSWYMVAGADGGDPRTYRVSRIQSTTRLPGTFTRPEGFDLVDYWREWSQGFRERMYTAKATLRIAPGAGPLLRHTLSAEMVDAALAEAGPPDGRGWVTIVVPVESIRHARWLLLRMGAQVEVLDPADLRTGIEEEIRSLAALYGLLPSDGEPPADG